jgi:pyruvate/2-oxoacid:ferredoxin oxidoreductase beta subunit
VAPYLKKQGRFRHLTDEQIAGIQSEVSARWESLRRRVEAGA